MNTVDMYSILLTTLLVAATPAGAGGHATHATIEDDYVRAVAEAKARNVPLVVDVWAPW